MTKTSDMDVQRQEMTLEERWQRYCERFNGVGCGQPESFDEWVRDYADELKDRGKYE